MNEDTLLELVDFCVVNDATGLPVVQDVSLRLAPGETIAIVGESGSGKSMTAKAIAGLLPKGFSAQGGLRYGGRDIQGLPERHIAPLRGCEIGLVMQDPFTMLSPVVPCGVHISELLRSSTGRRLSRSDQKAEEVRRLSEVGIRDPAVAGRYPFQLSGGMCQRVGIAAALARDPRLLIADEPSTALDVTTQRDILALLKKIQLARRMGLILITHDLRVAFAMCDRVYVMYAGSIVESAPPAELSFEPLHPYTLGLLMSDAPLDKRIQRLEAIPGKVPRGAEGTNRCQFAPRCQWCSSLCEDAKPPLRLISEDRATACRRLDEIRGEMAARRTEAQEVAAQDSTSHRLDPPVVLEARRLCKTYGRRGRTKRTVTVALNEVSITVSEGESVAVVGESGSGKTTLARCLVGLETPDSGEMLIGKSVFKSFSALPRQSRQACRRIVQIVFQDPYSSLNPAWSVGATLSEALAIQSGRDSRAAKNLDVADLLERVGLPASYAARKPRALSGGERQRVAIARALAAAPRILICDEPTSSLDVSVQAQILNLFRNVQADLGISLLFITHNLAIVRQLSDRVYVLKTGSVVESGRTESVLSAPQHPYTAKLLDSIPRSDPTWLGIALPGHRCGQTRKG